jgi:hypothetical protein
MSANDIITAAIILLIFGGAFVPAAIARRKGREFWLWWSYAGLLLPIALVHAILLRSRYIGCLHCRERCAADADHCWNCGRAIHSPGQAAAEASPGMDLA